MYLPAHLLLSAAPVTISSGDRGIFQTLAQMRAYVNEYRQNPIIRGCALNLVYFLPQKFDIGECDTLFQFVRDQIRYVKDIHQVETLSTPVITLTSTQGDCDDKSVLLASLFETVGYPTRFVLAGYNGSAFEHVYLQVFCVDEWVNCDATENGPFGYAPPGATRLFIEKV
jgi:hypothetical protein